MVSYRRMTLFAIGLVPAMLSAQATKAGAKDSTDVVAAVDRFHAAILAGDSAAVAGLLSSDATVLESGDIEARSDYLAHHLHADMQFAKAVSSKRQTKRVAVQGDVAWLTASSASEGRFEGREVHSEGAELMVLRRSGGSWRIAAIHWSSHRARGR